MAGDATPEVSGISFVRAMSLATATSMHRG